ncbi:hypothetical protein ABGT15_04335 [Flavobacterium enshiense]|uniref:hypothetical protein n=1 Tax=Flavobacterium enshiense TaxID=1341165 RepID=UPI00345CF2BE
MKKVLLDSISQVISAGILVILGFISMFTYSQITDKPFKTVFKDSITFQFPTYVIILIILGFILITSVVSYLRSNSVSSEVKYLKRKIKAFTSDDYRFTYNDIGLLCRYSVSYNNYTGKPFIHNLKLYCNKHTPPMEMFDGDCNVNRCDNRNADINEFSVQRHLESDIIHRWEEYDKKQKKGS